ncbi:CRISPR-associated primase-polymerase type A1 [Bacillus sp. 165]|uniref:CRISPR-associated primase-polymerase type A1 n=1 Tax=Bacillus sp. 165 TaxID=1529117 RepID=UPI001ADC0353|nr:CRISPR-associated primase-polymerase type A1 [Bacillus sp. 165]MBO9129096.1 hypothetical protein [Bacillus sp. 165]
MLHTQFSILFPDHIYQAAWTKLQKNGSDAAGVDRVKLSDIEANPEEFIEGIKRKLVTGLYTPSAIKEISISKNDGKFRKIGILTIEDRYIHMLVKCWLEPFCLHRFNENSYAYQPGKSASQAVGKIEQWIKDGYEWIGETDISSFFDDIDHEILKQQITRFVKDPEKISFIEYLLSIQEKGVIQGSPLSPLLANIYLHEFDEFMSREGRPYVRFSDDLIVMEKSKEAIEMRMQFMKQSLHMLRLDINDDKTGTRNIGETFEFLGYRFNKQGKQAGEEGVSSLVKRLEEIYKTENEQEIRVEKYKQVVNGWRQYFQSIPWKELQHAEQMLLALEMEENQSLIPEIYEVIRSKITRETIDEWQLSQLMQMAVLSEAQVDALFYAALLYEDKGVLESNQKKVLQHFRIKEEHATALFQYLVQVHRQEEEALTNCLEWLVSEQHFELAQLLHDAQSPIAATMTETQTESVQKDPESVFFHFQHLFSGYENMFLMEELIEGKRRFQEIRRPWHTEDIESHYNGEITLAQYIIRSNKTLKYVIVDIDISKRVLHEIDGDETAFQKKKKEAFEDAVRIYSTYKELGFSPYLVDSGFRGYHVWVFFEEPLHIQEAYEFVHTVTAKAGTPTDGIIWEAFPKQRKLRPDHFGQAIKLPWGKHTKTKQQSWFIDETGEVIEDQFALLLNIKLAAKTQVHRVTRQENLNTNRLPIGQIELPRSVRTVLYGCPIVKHIVDKAEQTSYLNHQERLLLLNVFGPMGKEGHDFIHKIISYTMNYNQKTTQKFINRSYNKPISCVRIREHFPSLTSQLPCNCVFKTRKGQYPSPVLHHGPLTPLAEAKKEPVPKAESNTKPTDSKNVTDAPSSTETRENKKENYQTKVNELATKLVELRKHQRGLQKNVRKVEQELQSLFSELQTERMETQYGYLVCRKEQDTIHWVIEL